jgi:hypothetical protein
MNLKNTLKTLGIIIFIPLTSYQLSAKKGSKFPANKKL